MDLRFPKNRRCCTTVAERFVRDNYTFDKRRKIAATEPGWRTENWTQFAELGLLGMAFSEEQGGLRRRPDRDHDRHGGVRQGLVVEPYLPTVVIGGGLIAAAGTQGAEGRAAAADDRGQEASSPSPAPKRQGRYNLADVSLKATKEGAGWSLNGHKAVVIGAPFADHLIVTARTARRQRDEKGVSSSSSTKAKGVTTRDYPTVDGCAPRKSPSRTSRSAPTP